MFSQYKASKATIRRNYVINLLNGVRHEGLLQDALGLLYLDLADNRPDNHVMKYIIRQWDLKALPDPFEQKDQATIAKLYKLFSSMSMFVEDYISKAASPNPPQAYLCLPQIADPNKGLYYKEHSFSPRHVTLDELTLPECHFLMWAFIKYDIIFKIQGPKAALVIDDNEQGAISKKEYEALTDCEHEALHSVLQYVDAAYGALFTVSTRCSSRHTSSALQDKPADPVTLLYPDNLYFNPIRAFDDMMLPSQNVPTMLGYAHDVSDYGFDLLRALVLFANTTQPEDIRSWFYTIFSHWPRSRYRRPRNHRFAFLSRSCRRSINDRDGSLSSLLVQRLSPTDTSDSVSYPLSSWVMQRNIFRQRAWVFLDDTRLFQMGLGHFPTIEELGKQSTSAPGFEERRQLRHLQLCLYRREAGIEDTQTEGREYIFSSNDEDSIPRLFDPPSSREVTTFWQHI
ncbi:hypothetical protein FANTH_12044 [Fusarium anthophilum]|uniref:Uncharacterized protein n=1 Tax=Fusarium anthophilum TaxID=48485 RepID=A0A8H4YVB9_9HYPO|nr:hypothetical protein FANTH_12044 [Fusarium anthophilum]